MNRKEQHVKAIRGTLALLVLTVTAGAGGGCASNKDATLTAAPPAPAGANAPPINPLQKSQPRLPKLSGAKKSGDAGGI
ncbi:MAG: hypothetical protein H7Z41_17000 [Cytophagales bacterium]|nr:hypothetical protein [Armatimonadota bacterium]